MQLDHLRAVRNAANPILLQEAVKVFGLRSPELDAFLKKGTDYCLGFKQRFPEIAILENQKIGHIQAAWDGTIGLFTDFYDGFAETKAVPHNDEELISSLF